MTTEQLLDMTILLEHLKGGGKKTCRDINRVYGYLPMRVVNLPKKQKIREIQQYWDKLADETIKQYLINKQNGISGNTEN